MALQTAQLVPIYLNVPPPSISFDLPAATGGLQQSNMSEGNNKRRDVAVAAVASRPNQKKQRTDSYTTSCSSTSKETIECCVCHLKQSDFTKAQRKKAKQGLEAMCRSCWDKQHDNPRIYQCSVCRSATSEFTTEEKWKARRGKEAKCRSCFQKEEEEEKKRVWEERAQKEAKLRVLLSKYRRCCGCGKFKAEEDFSTTQWDTPRSVFIEEHLDHPEYGWISRYLLEHLQQGKACGKCLECYPKEEEDRDIAEEQRRCALERKEREKEEKEREREKSKSYFEYPFDLWHASDDYFRSTLPNTLVGEYDVIYHHGVWCSGEGGVQRTVDATLTLSRNGETVSGSVSFADQDVEEGWDRPDFDFEVSSRAADHLDFNIVKLPEALGVEGLEPYGSIRVLKKRVACRWIPDEQKFAGDGDNDESDNGFIPRFNSAEEAEAYLTSQARQTDNSWMRNYLGLKPHLVSSVHEYLRPWRPSPSVVFFEEGDLWIQAVWYCDDHAEHSESQFIARRRTTANDVDRKEEPRK